MPAPVIIAVANLAPLLQAVFESPAVAVYTSESDYGEPTRSFSSADQLIKHLNERVRSGSLFESYALHYADAGGHVQDRRIELDPDKHEGHTFRHSVAGWGVIYLKIKLLSPETASCTLVVNSRKRAEDWSAKYPDLKSPALWNWSVVENHVTRLDVRARQAALH